MDYFLDAFDFTSLLLAFIGGSLIGIPSGPARFFVVDTALNEGRTAAIRVYSGLFLVSMLYAALALLLDDLISDNQRIEAISYFIAALLLIFWGGLIILKSNKEKRSSSVKLNFGSWFIKGFVVGASSLMTPFIYLAFVQLLKLYSNDVSLLQKISFILVFELFSFMTTSVVAIILMKKKKSVLGSWKTMKILMGILLIGFGIYNAYQQLDFSDGIRIKLHEGFIEKQMTRVNE